MAKGSTLLASTPFRGMLVGYPGAGKTGALACLLNAGFKLRVLDFDGNLEPLLKWADPAKLDNLDAIHFEDQTRIGSGFLEPVGIPQAFANALRAMDQWKYPGPDGVEVDLGASKDWGPDTIVVLDSTRTMGDAAFRRAMKMLNKTPMNTTDRVWGLAMSEQAAFLNKLGSSSNRFHVIILSHLKMVGPKDVRSGDSDLTTTIKGQVADLIGTRLYPWVLGWQLPQTIAGDFSTVLEVASTVKAGQVKRVIRWQPRQELDLKLPANMGDVKELDIKDGLLHIFRAVSPASVRLVEEGETKNG